MSPATESARALFRVTPSGVLLAASVRGSGVSVLQLVPLIALLRGALLVLDRVRALASPRPAAPSTMLKILRPSVQRSGGEWAATARHAALGCVIVLRGASALLVSASLLSASDKPYLAGLLMPLLLCLTLTARNTGRSGMTISTLVLACALLVAGVWDANSRGTAGAALNSVADWRGARVLLVVFLAVSALAEVDYAMDGVCHCGDNPHLPRAVTIWLGTLSVVLFSALGASMYSSWFVDGDPAGPSTSMRVLLSCILSLWASQAGMDAAALASERGKVWCDERMRGASLNASARLSADIKDWILFAGACMLTIGTLFARPSPDTRASDQDKTTAATAVLAAGIAFHAVAVAMGHRAFATPRHTAIGAKP